MVWVRDPVGTYLVIGPERLFAPIGALLEQKRERGYTVELKAIESFGGVADLEHHIRKFVLGTGPDYLLLVGDHDTMPGYPVDVEGKACRSDSLYSMHDADFYPRVPTGRLSSNDPGVLARICDALVSYPADPGPEWRRRVVLTGWLPRAPDTPDTDWTSDAAYRCMSEIGPYFDVSMQFEYDPSYWTFTPAGQALWGVGAHTSKQALVEAIERGAAVVQYAGHGSPDRWSNIGRRDGGVDEFLGVADVETLDPGGRLPLVLSTTCLTGQISRGPSFAEAWQQYGKAVGILASDVEAATWSIDRLTSQIWHQIVTRGLKRVGDILVGAMKSHHHADGNAASVRNGALILRYLGDPDTILAGPEDAARQLSRTLRVPLEHWGGTQRCRATVDFGRRVRAATPVLLGWNLEQAGRSLLVDRFEAEQLDDRWTPVDEGTSDGPSCWIQGGGYLVQTSNIYTHDGGSIDKRGTYCLWRTGERWRDYRVTVRMRSEDDDAMGLMFRVRNADNYYRFSWDKERAYRRLTKCVAGTFSVLAEDSVAFERSREYTLSVTVQGASIRLAIDGAEVFEVSDSSVGEGSVAPYSWGNHATHFAALRVEWLGAKAPRLLEENFDLDVLDRDWTIIDEGNISAPSRWRVSSGNLTQVSNIYGGSGAGLAMPGTFCYWTRGTLWTDYQLTSRMRSADDDAIGVMFRVRDARNYYRFSWDRQRARRRLVKCVDGRFELLAEDTVRYEINRTYQVTVTVRGSQIGVYVDGANVFAVEDASVAHGTIALYTWGNQGSFFDRILVESLAGEADAAPALPAGISLVSNLSTTEINRSRVEVAVDVTLPAGVTGLPYKGFVDAAVLGLVDD